MTTQNSSGEGQNPQGEGNEDGKKSEVTLEQLQAELEAERQRTARLLEESKKYKSSYQETKSKLEQSEQEKLLKEGDINKILEAEKQKASTLENELSSMKKKTVLSNIRQTVAKFAQDAYSIDDLLNQPHFKMLVDNVDGDSLTVDEKVAKSFVDTVYKEKPWLRKTTQEIKTADGKPSFNENNKPFTIESLMDKPASDLEKELLKRFS